MNTKKLMEKTYGEPILLKDANLMIKEFIDLSGITVKSVKPDEQGTSIASSRRTKAEELNSNSCNAFIFSKDLIMRFFDGTETDKFHNPHSANYLMVVLGAHPTKVVKKDGETFEAGSFTVLTAGCEKRIVTVKGKEHVAFYPLNIYQAANEYPPHQVVLQLEQKEGFLPTDFFLVTE